MLLAIVGPGSRFGNARRRRENIANTGIESSASEQIFELPEPGGWSHHGLRTTYTVATPPGSDVAAIHGYAFKVIARATGWDIPR